MVEKTQSTATQIQADLQTQGTTVSCTIANLMKRGYMVEGPHSQTWRFSDALQPLTLGLNVCMAS
jgi:hypothetical protein